MIHKIRTLPVLRSEIKMYSALKREQNKIVEDYETPLRKLENMLSEVEEELTLVKSPGKGDGLGGYVQNSLEKLNYLIDKKTKLENERDKHIKANRDQYLKEYFSLNQRLNVIEYYLAKLDSTDREFIEDLYVNQDMKFSKVMDKYNIKNEGNVTRKANKILKNLLL